MALVPARCLSGVLVVTLLLASCASYQYQPIKPADIPGSLNAGDTVRVVTRDGRESQFEIAAITPDAIVGEDQRIQLADVKELERLERREFSPGDAKVIGVLVVIVLLVLLGVVAAGATGGGDRKGGFCFVGCGR